MRLKEITEVEANLLKEMKLDDKVETKFFVKIPSRRSPRLVLPKGKKKARRKARSGPTTLIVLGKNPHFKTNGAFSLRREVYTHGHKILAIRGSERGVTKARVKELVCSEMKVKPEWIIQGLNDQKIGWTLNHLVKDGFFKPYRPQ